MKKNISINISGIIFHIEEDGYESLRKYLDSINKYFSSFEDSSEILADIESRIAEIFLSKLNEGKQVITAEDVNSLITTMGSVSDFKAAEEQEFTQSGTTGKQYTANAENTASSSSSSSGPQNTTGYTQPKRLMRDQRRKILGGVCTGLGNYFNVDPVWIRLVFALLAFAYGITLIVYLVMWIVVPGSYDLEEPQVEKKLFRDSEHKVIGGVSGGVAAYFRIDIVAVRLLFVLLTFAGGLGLLVYVVLWIVLPEARTLTDRMQMQGEPVTLSNIESNIKKNLNIDENKEENAFTKIILFPFRLLGMLLTGLGKIFGPLVEVIRVAIGVLTVLTGVFFVLSTIIAGGVLLGLFSVTALSWTDISSFPVREFSASFPGWIAIAGFIGALVPGIFIILLGASIIAKRIVFGATAGWTLLVMFIVSVALLSVGIPKIIYAFKEDGTYKTETVYPVNGKKIMLKLNEVGMDDYQVASLYLKGYDGKDVKLIQEFQAQGNTRQRAIENAHMIDYHVDVQDSIFTFDSNVAFKENAVFRAQRLEMTLYLPYDLPFTMTEDVSRFIRQYVDRNYLDDHTWRMTPKGLDCLSCPVADGDPEDQEEAEREDYSLSDFTEIEISGLFDATITKGNEYGVEFTGSESEKEKYKISKEDNTLVIEYNDDNRRVWNKDLLNMDEIKINITMPDIERLDAKGAGKVDLRNFDVNDLEIHLTGAVEARGNLDAKDININLTGASQLELEGTGHTMDAQIQGASSLRAFSFKVKDASVEVNGASSAKVNVSGTLEMEEGIASDIDYRGKPEIIKRN
jgi:phage shock protein PspC (stress-responsive transcriptional regulator)